MESPENLAGAKRAHNRKRQLMTTFFLQTNVLALTHIRRDSRLGTVPLVKRCLKLEVHPFNLQSHGCRPRGATLQAIHSFHFDPVALLHPAMQLDAERDYLLCHSALEVQQALSGEVRLNSCSKI